MDVRSPRRGMVGALVTAAVAALTAAACAAGGGSSPFDDPSAAPARGAAITVDNGGTQYSDLVVYLIPESGVRRRLGTVRLNERKTFPVEGVDWGGRFLLLADAIGGREIRSRRFPMDRGDLIQWDLSINTITYGRRSRGI